MTLSPHASTTLGDVIIGKAEPMTAEIAAEILRSRKSRGYKGYPGELAIAIAKTLRMSRAVCEREANLNNQIGKPDHQEAILSFRQQRITLDAAIEELVTVIDAHIASALQQREGTLP